MPVATATAEPPLDPPGYSVGGPGIPHGAKVRVFRGDPVSKLVHVRFAEKDRSRPARGGAPRRYPRIGNKILEDLRTRRGADAFRLEVVF
jgi:hypothetical protein